MISFGVVPDGRVSDALTRLWRFIDPDLIAIVRCVDSSASPDDIAKILAFHGVGHNVVCKNVILTINDLQTALKAEVFTGFDEVWIVAGAPPDFDLSHLRGATSDGIEFSTGFPEALANAMAELNCMLILGDGCGLNYATSSGLIRQELAKWGAPGKS
jgi:hypothetical protein